MNIPQNVTINIQVPDEQPSNNREINESHTMDNAVNPIKSTKPVLTNERAGATRNRHLLTLMVNPKQKDENQTEFRELEERDEGQSYHEENIHELNSNIIKVNYERDQQIMDDESRISREHTPKSVNTVTQINLHFNTPYQQQIPER